MIKPAKPAAQPSEKDVEYERFFKRITPLCLPRRGEYGDVEGPMKTYVLLDQALIIAGLVEGWSEDVVLDEQKNFQDFLLERIRVNSR